MAKLNLVSYTHCPRKRSGLSHLTCAKLYLVQLCLVHPTGYALLSIGGAPTIYRSESPQILWLSPMALLWRAIICLENGRAAQ